MMTDAFHPDHLKPGDMVGPWRIVESLGSGSFGHAFKTEYEGAFFTMKMAVRPAPDLSQDNPEKLLEERQVDGRMCHEGAILLANTSHPGLPQLRAVGRWPDPKRGYFFFVTDHVPGVPFHDWRERTRPTAAQLVDLFIEVVRVVARLHRRGIFIRDFKSDHVIVPADHKPVLVDLGSAWLPGGSTLTVGLAPGTPHALPPECIAFIREGAWKQGARFEANETGDLYQLGVFMYEALTDCWPFDPRLTMDELLVAIEKVPPRAPHRMNPEVPKPLSLIALKLLEKRPEDRYKSAEALLQALWEANKERSTSAWKVPLELPPEGPARVTQEEEEERRVLKQEVERRAQAARKQRSEELSREQALEQLSLPTQGTQEPLILSEEKAARRKKGWRRIALAVGSLLMGVAVFTAWWAWRSPTDSTANAPSEKGSSFMPALSNSPPVKAVAAWLCATLSVGCASTPGRPLPGRCPEDAVRSMEELDLLRGTYQVVLDINQPGETTERGTYRPGPLVSKVVKYTFTGPLPEGTLLYGQLQTEGINGYVAARYTEALLPDGRRIPVCFVLGGWNGLLAPDEGSKPDAVRLPREFPAHAVDEWP